ncbi:FAD-dependent monooxygenase [Streptomyces sp. MAR4 CNX-425]|uniref:FAD-dependent monooxygenase n=1 Tax=Streptomyces sp. MAR4 CNX-425 TaxID=3406343 RepID=UPI003B512FF8
MPTRTPPAAVDDTFDVSGTDDPRAAVARFRSPLTRMLLGGDGLTTTLLESWAGSRLRVGDVSLRFVRPERAPRGAAALLGAAAAADTDLLVRHSTLTDAHGRLWSWNQVVAGPARAVDPAVRRCLTDGSAPLGPALRAAGARLGRAVVRAGVTPWPGARAGGRARAGDGAGDRGGVPDVPAVVRGRGAGRRPRGVQPRVRPGGPAGGAVTGPRRRLRTQVAIVGAGPAGLVLANVLLRAGVDAVLVERRSRADVERRARAGLVEHRIVEYLRAHGLADRLLADGTRHGWCEFLCAGRLLRFDYAAQSGGVRHWVYPQQLLVRDLVAALYAAGRPPEFSRPAVRVHAGADGSGHARVECAGLDVDCDYVVGCDGPYGVSAHALPAAPAPEPEPGAGPGAAPEPGPQCGLDERYPYDWLTLLAEVDRVVPGVVYAVHEDGFAGVMPRTARLARLYLEIPAGDAAARWTPARVHERLRTRLTGAGAAVPRLGRIVESGVLRMRSRVRQRFQHGRLFLAGDAAHVLTPSGAKGMNLAVADAADLADALIRRYRHGDEAYLAGYTSRRLPEVLRTRNLAAGFLDLLHPRGPQPADRRAALAARLARLTELAAPGAAGAAFAHWYVGAGPDLPVPHTSEPTP